MILLLYCLGYRGNAEEQPRNVKQSMRMSPTVTSWAFFYTGISKLVIQLPTFVNRFLGITIAK